MALIKAETNAAGITGNYWRLVRIIPPVFNGGAQGYSALTTMPGVNVGPEGWGYGTLTFELYRDSAARKTELRQPLATKDITLPGDFFMGMVLVGDVSLVKRVIYERHANIPGFTDATPDFDVGDANQPVDEAPSTGGLPTP